MQGYHLTDTYHLYREFLNPVVPWLCEVGSFVAWGLLFAYFLRRCIRARTLTIETLIFISTTTMCCTEFYADWGGFVIFNPKFKLMPWGPTLWTTPYKPWWVIPSEGIWWTFAWLPMLWVYARLRTHFPKLKRTTAIVIAAVPLCYAYDIITDGIAPGLGWWTFTAYMGPAITWARGSYPLLYSITLVAVMDAIIIGLLTNRGSDGHVRFEQWFRIDHISNSLLRGLAQIGVWSLVMNGLYWTTTVIPLIVLRLLFESPGSKEFWLGLH